MAGRRSGRAAARRASAALQKTPRNFDPMEEDEPQPPAASSDAEAVPEPDDDKDDDEEDGKEEQEEKDEDDEAQPEVEEAEASTKEPSPPPVATVRRKRLGRPPKNPPPDWDPMITVPVTELDTPRRRGRGGWRGRGGRKPGPGQTPLKQRQAIDKEGNEADIVNDECVLPEDPEGETKVDKNGVLQGDREYRCRTFTVLGRGDKLYMLSTEPARCVGFRDSYLFFTKHLKLHKVILDDEEKRDMIDRELIPHSYKGRSIGIVTARSVFREFGARIVVGGKRIIDDYRVADARAEGVVEGEIADPNDSYNPNEPYNKNQYVAWHGASSVYHQNPTSAPDPLLTKAEPKKRRVNINNTNWMLEHAREASNFNSGINELRKLNNTGVYDIHTNMLHYPAHMQPTHARFEQMSLREEDDRAPTTAFPRVQPAVVRKKQVLDIHYESAPTVTPNLNRGNAWSSDFLGPFRGLGAVSDDLKDLLPPECRQAFDDALSKEEEYKGRWGSEQEHGCRREPVIDKSIVPGR